VTTKKGTATARTTAIAATLAATMRCGQQFRPLRRQR